MSAIPPDPRAASSGGGAKVENDDRTRITLMGALLPGTPSLVVMDDATTPLAATANALRDWLWTRALPAWSNWGMDERGFFAEALGLDGSPIAAPRRARVQARQIYAFLEAGRLGWPGSWRDVAERGFARLEASHLREDGRMRALLAHDGSTLDANAAIYDQAFLLLARAAAHRAGVAGAHEDKAVRLRETLLAEALPQGGFREYGAHSYQSNAHMHLLEASLAWEEAGGDALWRRLSDTIVDLALSRFIDELGQLHEVFDSNWAVASDNADRIEPGHQFEWAWLLWRYGERRADERAQAASRRLYASGSDGVCPRRGVAVDEIGQTGALNVAARLWPQAEWLKAALQTKGGERDRDCVRAWRGLNGYLLDTGLWRDKRRADGGFVIEPAPSSTLYHLMSACGAALDAAEREQQAE